jgi:hypothetical protein
MTDPRIHPVQSEQARGAAVGEYKRDGYTITEVTDDYTDLEYSSRGSLLTHLALFFTIGWLFGGLLNLWYARRTRKKTHDIVRVQVQ